MSVLGAVLSQSFEQWVASQSGAYWVGINVEDTVTTGSLAAFEWTVEAEDINPQHIAIRTSVVNDVAPSNVGFYVKATGPGFVTFGLHDTDSGGHSAGAVSASLEAIWLPVRDYPTE